MMIPYGYKQTEVGVIPEDWSVDTIGAVTLSVTNGGNYKNSAQISLYPLIKMGNISRGYINLKKIEYVIGFPPSENDRLTYGDVLLNTRNTPELVGKVAIWKNELSRAYFNSNLLRFNFKLEKSDPFFMNLIFNTEQVISEFRNIAKGTTSVAAIYPQDMLKVKIIIPPLQEQQRIAEALSDVDGMISSLEKLIAKYKSIKTACLQQMFPQNGETVPRMRLPGFTGAWEQRKLGDVVQITMGQSPDGSTYSDEPSDYILVQGNADLQNGWVCPRIWTTQITKKADAGDLIMSVRAPAGAMGKTAYNAVIGRGVAAIKGNEFIYQLLVKMDTDGFWKTLSCGSTFESLNSDNIKNAEVKIPTTAEQIKIGGFFQYLDNLITLHQRKLEKIQKIKQGMMQQLLTGKIRLV